MPQGNLPNLDLDAPMDADLQAKMRADIAAKDTLLPSRERSPEQEAQDEQPYPDELPPVGERETIPAPPPMPQPPAFDPTERFQSELAMRDQRLAELEAKLSAKEASEAEQAEQRESQGLRSRLPDLQKRIVEAIRQGDQAAAAELQFERDDVQRDLNTLQQKEYARMVKGLSAPTPQRQSAAPQQAPNQRAVQQADTFIRVHRVSESEQQRMIQHQRTLIQSNPAWAQAEPWHLFDAALKMERGSKNAPRAAAPAMEGGTNTAPSRSTPKLTGNSRISQSTYAKAARMMGYSQDDYAKLVEGKR